MNELPNSSEKWYSLPGAPWAALETLAAKRQRDSERHGGECEGRQKVRY